MSTQNDLPDVTPAPRGEAQPRPWYRRRIAVFGAAACLAAAGALAIGIPSVVAAAAAETSTVSSAPSSGTTTQTSPYDSYGSYGRYGNSAPGSSSGSPSGSTGTSTQEAATTASSDESTGVVLIDTVLGYENGAAAGTGMVLTSDGLVLTNNHVVEGATEIQVTIASTGETYTATVVGTDATDDVALLQLEGASGLQTVTIDENDTETVGDEITAVGNAEGGGVLMAADGTITDLEATVTTASEAVVSSETLDGMIEISADVVSGDSGGALLASDGEVIGMTTAASSGSATVTAYAIPIDDALALVQQILDGDTSGGVTLGYPAFLGVAIAQGYTSAYAHSGTTSSAVDGALIGGVFENTPAASAGLAAGDTITAVDGTAISSADELSTTLDGYAPGDTVTITWTDSSGTTHSASVTLMEGPVE